MSRIERIYIRAMVDGKWGSYSLKELIDNSHQGQVARWFMDRILNAIGLSEGEVVNENHIEGMLIVLDRLQIPPIEIKEQP